MKYFDGTLYLVTDRSLAKDIPLETIVEMAIRGGVTLVQLREKNIDAKDFYDHAIRLKEITDKYHIPLIINDRIDIMMAVGAEGVHVGQEDIPAAAVRKIIGPDKVMGVSAHNLKEALQAEKDGADYIGVGSIYPTDTKKNTSPVSLQELQKICQNVSIPVIAIGGINNKNLTTLLGTNISGIAVVSAIIKTDSPETSARNLLKVMKSFKK